MFIKKYKSIMAREEEHRSKWATGLTFVFTILIFASFAFYKGFFSFGNSDNFQNNVANVISADQIPSPIQNTGKTFSAAFAEINKKYQEFKNSVSNVLVPFVTGVDIYERKEP